ncbi:14203_t:CDS:2, partial [Rhizophagus irregularis]
LKVLGYSFQQYHCGIYYDGHEREDVLQYRKEFLENIFNHEKYMSKYEGEFMDQIYLNLPEGEKERVLVVHDECIFYLNDRKHELWTKNADIEKHPYITEEAQCFLKPGINQKGYWTAKHLLEQIECKAIPIFEALYPDCIAVFAFDNISNHTAFSKDALVASRMNLNPGGKQPVMRNTYFGPNNQLQTMVFPITYHDEKLYDCKECKEKIQDISRTTCCAHRVISLEPDFIAQKGTIEELIENAGHKCIFFPKFHCELNFIERYWDAAKRYSRENCDYLWERLQKIVPESLNLVNLTTIRKFSRKIWRYIDFYRKGIDGKLVEYTIKKYKSYRRIPECVLEELNKFTND